jgi:hypothetical protein
MCSYLYRGGSTVKVIAAIRSAFAGILAPADDNEDRLEERG